MSSRTYTTTQFLMSLLKFEYLLHFPPKLVNTVNCVVMTYNLITKLTSIGTGNNHYNHFSHTKRCHLSIHDQMIWPGGFTTGNLEN
jgi:hypothetical protein